MTQQHTTRAVEVFSMDYFFESRKKEFQLRESNFQVWRVCNFAG